MQKVYNGANIYINYSTNVKLQGESMKKTDQLHNMIELNNGYLFSSEAEALGISRTYISKYIKENSMEKVARGIYVTEDTWPDDLFVLQRTYSDIIYSGETALYLHQLIDREYSEISVSVPIGFSGSRLREKGIVIHQEKPETHELGVEEITTNFGNKVLAYNKERCICDLIRNRGKYEVQNFQTAIKSYMRSKNKDLSRLAGYAEALKIRDEVMRYVEVLV